MSSLHPARIPRTVVYFGKYDPRARVGGAEAFARNLALVFERVVYMRRANADFAHVRRERLPIICDNQHVLELPRDLPAIGFQHGVAAEKVFHAPSLRNLRMALDQARAAKRARTLWVACAQWISERFGQLHGNRAAHVIYHPIDIERFDGRLDNSGSRLVLHDARSNAKGKKQIAWLADALPQYAFEPLACAPSEVPDRMRKARAFIHLSRYEGNSIVCNEAMASDLPCLFTRVGVLRDDNGPSDVAVIDPTLARRDRRALVRWTRDILGSLDTKHYHPRAWVLEHASPAAAHRNWQRAIDDLDRMWRALG